MTAATRKAAERQRKEAAGLVRVEVWVPAEDAEAVRELAQRLRWRWRFDGRAGLSIVREGNGKQANRQLDGEL